MLAARGGAQGCDTVGITLSTFEFQFSASANSLMTDEITIMSHICGLTVLDILEDRATRELVHELAAMPSKALWSRTRTKKI